MTEHDEVYRKSEAFHALTISFLKSLRDNLPAEEAGRLAADGFAHYMIDYYARVLGETPPGSQERFDAFRGHYEERASRSPYLQMVGSTANELRVRYDRCPFVEVLQEHRLAQFASAFCESDYRFTENLLPGVVFERHHEIARGAAFCDHSWRFNAGKGNRDDG